MREKVTGVVVWREMREGRDGRREEKRTLVHTERVEVAVAQRGGAKAQTVEERERRTHPNVENWTIQLIDGERERKKMGGDRAGRTLLLG